MGARLSREVCLDGRKDEDLKVPQPRVLGRPRTAHGKFLRVIQVNDVYMLQNYPKVRTAIQQMKACAKDDDCEVIAILPGDFLSPCTITSLDGGSAMTQVLNEVGFDYVCFGNHEFDLKPSVLQRRVKEFQGTWLNSNITSPIYHGHDDKPLPEYVVLKLGERKVALGAFLLNDMDQFAPVDQPTIQAPEEAMGRIWDLIHEKEGSIDLFCPLVHLNIKNDRHLAMYMKENKRKELADKTPVLFGSHDHEIFIEEAGKALIFKTGCDANNVGVVDIWWTPQGKLKRQTHLFDVDEFPQDSKVQQFVSKRLLGLGQMLQVPIFDLPEAKEGEAWSTENVRFSEEPLVGFLLSLVKSSMPGVDIVFLQGGNVRGHSKYTPGPFTYGDLMREFAFDTLIGTVDMPGEVIEATIRATRTQPEDGAKPFFLHCDGGVVLSNPAEPKIETVDGQPFDRQKTYKVGTYQFLLTGMGTIQPMLGYVQEHNLAPPIDRCKPIKHYVLETCMHRAWRDLIDPSSDEMGMTDSLAGKAFRSKITDAFNKLDTNGDGFVDEQELTSFITDRGKNVGGEATGHLVKFLINTLDSNDDHKLELNEILALAP